MIVNDWWDLYSVLRTMILKKESKLWTKRDQSDPRKEDNSVWKGNDNFLGQVILLTYYLQKEKTLASQCWAILLKKLKTTIQEKCLEMA